MDDKIDRYVFQLKSLRADWRKEAIEHLIELGDLKAVEPLNQIAENDPDADLRFAAASAITQIRQTARTRADKEFQAPASDPIAQVFSGKVEPSERDKRIANTHLRQATSYHKDRSKWDHALYHLAMAIKLNPLLIYEKFVPNLTADLLESGESSQQAVRVLLQRIANNEIVRPPLELLDTESKTDLPRAGIASAYLLFLFAVLFVILSGEKPSLALAFSSVLPALVLLGVVLISNMVMFGVAATLGGDCAIPRFLRAILNGQIAAYTIIISLMAALPAATALRTPDGLLIAVIVSPPLVGLAFGLTMLIVIPIITNLMQFTSEKSMVAALLGVGVGFIMVIVLGLFRHVRLF